MRFGADSERDIRNREQMIRDLQKMQKTDSTLKKQ